MIIGSFPVELFFFKVELNLRKERETTSIVNRRLVRVHLFTDNLRK